MRKVILSIFVIALFYGCYNNYKERVIGSWYYKKKTNRIEYGIVCFYENGKQYIYSGFGSLVYERLFNIDEDSIVSKDFMFGWIIRAKYIFFEDSIYLIESNRDTLVLYRNNVYIPEEKWNIIDDNSEYELDSLFILNFQKNISHDGSILSK